MEHVDGSKGRCDYAGSLEQETEQLMHEMDEYPVTENTGFLTIFCC